MNLSGAGVVATSDNKDDAQKLLEWLATDGQDDMHRAATTSSRSTPTCQPDEVAAAFGAFEPMPIDAEAYGARNAEALDLLAEAGYE